MINMYNLVTSAVAVAVAADLDEQRAVPEEAPAEETTPWGSGEEKGKEQLTPPTPPLLLLSLLLPPPPHHGRRPIVRGEGRGRTVIK